MQSLKRFTESARTDLKKAIADANGNEIFVLGYIDDDGLITHFEVRARGNKDSVLALFDLVDTIENIPNVLIHNHPPPGRILTPSDNDLIIAGRFAQEGIGSYIVDNKVENVYVIAEPIRAAKKKSLNSSKIISQLEEGGIIASRLPHYESRQSQLDLMALIIRGFNEEALVAAEAGTGVGKSFAYLLPAISFALENEDRIVISTATITLQQQLYEKDIPLVISALKTKIKVCMIKGRSNYICLRRLNDTLKEKALFASEEETQTLEAICEWLKITQTGSRSDLSFMPPETLWTRICSESDSCMGMRCSNRDKCFVLLKRREAAASKILVVNHHLLFADLAARKQGAGYDAAVVLPPYSRIIIDEAHTIENSATSYFTGQFGRLGIFRILGRLYRQRGRAKGGVLKNLISQYNTAGENGESEIQKAVDNIREAVEVLNSNALELCNETYVFRFTKDKDSIIQNRLVPCLETLRRSLIKLTNIIENILDSISNAKDDDANNVKDNDAVWETRAAMRRINNIALLCGNFVEYADHPLDVLWIERKISNNKGAADWALFNLAPISIAENLKEALFEKSKTVVCVSATLTVSSSFDYWTSRTGINLAVTKDDEPRKVLFGNFPSPFPYSTAVLTAAPSNTPLPDNPEYQHFVEDAVKKLVCTSEGGALILFTSFESLRNTYNACAGDFTQKGFKCLRQGDDDRHRLLKDFLEDTSSVLFATDSFWEGVDAPGETLRMLILCRLPFRAPNDPVFKARCELIEKKGGNSFMELSVPESVMKFRQGFGRLMRRASDRGVVAVLDGRILKKSYGKIFLYSLPKTKTCFADMGTILNEVERILF
ncbi:MAG: ATP-dependent DNA helicase DinG [Spirochaetaceae bacterium]|jgi:ATP-dependent DNA helicase DinG|nr:ATP-dependent DNA helicase DinG [Spirochaetaceae bacterium]